MPVFADYFRNQAIEQEKNIAISRAEQAFKNGAKIYHVRSYRADVISATRSELIGLGYYVSDVKATFEVNPEYSFTVQY